MPYIGNEVGNRFVASKAASVYSGNGSTTAFTLEHAVGSDEDILVSVDGVIQEPSVAYAVSSGTTLTFTAAPSSNSGNNIFVYYLFRTVATVDHSSTSSLQATDATFTGAVTANAGVSIDNITIDGTEIDLSSGDLTLDVAGDIILDADGGNWRFKDAGTSILDLSRDSNTSINFFSAVSDMDIVFKGNDGGSTIEAMRIDMSEGGRVGIGSNAPTTLLHLQGGEPDIFLRRTDLTNKAWRFNVQSSTGDLNIKSRNDDGSASTTSMIIHHDGYVTKPLQPAFQVHPASQQNNLTVNAYTTIAFGTERFDNNSDFASNTFTAPVTGKYQLNLIIYFLSIDIDANYWQINLETSNQTYYQVIVPKFSADLAYHNFAMTVLADMDANDTSYLRIYQAGGAAQTDIAVATTFSGYLVC